jgi:uncharacterized protein (TIGR02118 family)
MIHQLIFAGPKPGMSVEEFQRYWLEVHAVRYASKIPQIRKYLIDTVLPSRPVAGQTPWSGVAEIWLADEQEQVASLQTPEFLQARLDEPRWAAFWRTVVLDTDAHEVLPGSGTGVKLILLAKRAEGIGLAEFRQRSLSKHVDLVLEVPGLRGYLQGHTRDGAYGVGEAVLDAAYQLWFDDVDALEQAMRSPQFARAEEDLLSFVVPRYLHRLAVAEHWIIGPQPR